MLNSYEHWLQRPCVHTHVRGNMRARTCAQLLLLAMHMRIARGNIDIRHDLQIKRVLKISTDYILIIKLQTLESKDLSYTTSIISTFFPFPAIFTELKNQRCNSMYEKNDYVLTFADYAAG